MKIDEISYKGYTIEIWYSKELKNFYTTSAVGGTVSNGTVKDAIKTAESIIKQFLETKINSYAELASMITESLVWISDSDCYADEQVIKDLVESYIKSNSINLKKN